MDYYNTNSLKGNDLNVAHKKGAIQRIKILSFFKNNPAAKLDCPDIHKLSGVEQSGAPLTSTRRAVCDLVSNGDLLNTGETKIGIYGKPNYMFRLNTNRHFVDYKQLSVFNDNNGTAC